MFWTSAGCEGTTWIIKREKLNGFNDWKERRYWKHSLYSDIVFKLLKVVNSMRGKTETRVLRERERERERQRKREGERERGREREKQRETEWEAERERERQTDRQTDSEREREGERQRVSERERERERERDRQTDRQTDRQWKRGRGRQRKSERQRVREREREVPEELHSYQRSLTVLNQCKWYSSGHHQKIQVLRMQRRVMCWMVCRETSVMPKNLCLCIHPVNGMFLFESGWKCSIKMFFCSCPSDLNGWDTSEFLLFFRKQGLTGSDTQSIMWWTSCCCF